MVSLCFYISNDSMGQNQQIPSLKEHYHENNNFLNSLVSKTNDFITYHPLPSIQTLQQIKSHTMICCCSMECTQFIFSSLDLSPHYCLENHCYHIFILHHLYYFSVQHFHQTFKLSLHVFSLTEGWYAKLQRSETVQNSHSQHQN